MKVFLTGASSGIGHALARELARRDPSLVLAAVARRRDAIEQLASRMSGATVDVHALDVTNAAALHAAAQDFIARRGVPDLVIANAGISAGTLTEHPEDRERFERIFATNVIAMFDTFSPFVARMRARGSGTLVGVASVSGVRGLAGGGAYCASKSAAITYLESLRLELRGSGVRVVTLSPGYIRTPMTARNPFPMPFLMDADAFAVRALDAIERGRSHVVLPWQMSIVARVMRLLPNALYDRLFARAPRKPRESGA